MILCACLVLDCSGIWVFCTVVGVVFVAGFGCDFGFPLYFAFLWDWYNIVF